jgi:hypothetical protein
MCTVSISASKIGALIWASGHKMEIWLKIILIGTLRILHGTTR